MLLESRKECFSFGNLQATPRLSPYHVLAGEQLASFTSIFSRSESSIALQWSAFLPAHTVFRSFGYLQRFLGLS